MKPPHLLGMRTAGPVCHATATDRELTPVLVDVARKWLRTLPPDDADLTDYWAAVRRKVLPPLDNDNLRLLAEHGARCPLCGEHILTADQPSQSPRD